MSQKILWGASPPPPYEIMWTLTDPSEEETELTPLNRMLMLLLELYVSLIFTIPVMT